MVTPVTGGPGSDTLQDDNGPNAFDGGGGSDTVSYSGAAKAVIADLASGFAYKLIAILPLGDSITYGVIGSSTNTESGGYRKFMSDELTDLGVKVDFVGALSNGPSSMPDRDHEGHRGWTINQLNGIDENVVATTQPDAVLLIAGTNDSSSDSVQTMVDDLRNLVLSLSASSPGTTVLVASVPPVRVGQQSQARADRVDAFNDAMPAMVAGLAAAGHNVAFVDMRDLTPDDISAPPVDSGLHPTADGYAKIAAHWMDALEQHLGLDGTGIGTDRDTFTSVENLTGSSFGDELGGNNIANRLDGRNGQDLLAGRGGDDTLVGGTGVDTLLGGTGNDIYIVDQTGDQTLEMSGEGIDQVWAYVDWTLAPNIENLFLRSGANLSGTGNGLDNIVSGTSGVNTLAGLGGDDLIEGHNGNDRLIGGTGDDTLAGGKGADTFVFGLGDGHDTVTDFDQQGNDVLEISGYESYSDLQQVGSDSLVVLSGSDSLLLLNVSVGSLTDADFSWVDPPDDPDDPPDDPDDPPDDPDDPPTDGTVGTEGADTLTGGSDADSIYGLGGDDDIDGRNRADHLVGGTGDDTLAGGKGADTFAFGLGDDHDTITDFDKLGNDVLEISGYDAYSDLQQIGSDSLVVFSDSDSILLLNVSVGTVTDSDFLWVDPPSDPPPDPDDPPPDPDDPPPDPDDPPEDGIVGSEGNDNLTGGLNADSIYGLGGDDDIDGGNRDDLLVGGTGDDTLAGGKGVDTFAFGLGDGHDTIIDFDKLGNDVMEISGYEAYTDLQQVGSDSLVVFSDSDSILLRNVSVGTVTDSDFLWVDPPSGNAFASTLAGPGDGQDTIGESDLLGDDVLESSDGAHDAVQQVGSDSPAMFSGSGAVALPDTLGEDLSGASLAIA